MSRWDKPSGRWVVFREYFSGAWCVHRWGDAEPVLFRTWQAAVEYANLRAGLDRLCRGLRDEMVQAWDTGNGDGYVAYRWAYVRLKQLLEGQQLLSLIHI